MYEITLIPHPHLEWNDFGDTWSCSTCGRAGDVQEDPTTVSCILPARNLQELDEQLAQLPTEADFLAHYDIRKYPAQALTADLAIFTIQGEELCILLIEREGHPEKGKLALPGGFVGEDESIEAAAHRKLLEETGLTLSQAHLEQLKTYGSPDRDPRGYIISTAHVALVPQVGPLHAGGGATTAAFYPVRKVLGEGFVLAFDHRQIVEDGLRRVRDKIEYAPLAPAFIGAKQFTISDLRRVYEIVWGVELNTSNFRRKVTSAKGFLKPLGKKGKSLSEGGREAALYKLGSAESIYPPLRR